MWGVMIEKMASETGGGPALEQLEEEYRVSGAAMMHCSRSRLILEVHSSCSMSPQPKTFRSISMCREQYLGTCCFIRDTGKDSERCFTSCMPLGCTAMPWADTVKAWAR